MAEWKQKLAWDPPPGSLLVETIEMHTAGEPLRVIAGGLPPIQGNTILEKRAWFRENLDPVRKALMHEPRGHPDMYGAVITAPASPDGHFGVFFMHNEGYSSMCGHAIIALTKLVLETGMVEGGAGVPEVRIDGPAGRITARPVWDGGKVSQVSFRNVPSFVLIKDEVVEIPRLGRVNFDVAYGGAFYAFCDARELGLNLDPTDYDKLIRYGRMIKKAVSGNFNINHPLEEELGFLYGTIFTGDPYDYAHHSRNVCVFADGQVDRSPTGTGISARAALHASRAELRPGQKIRIESLLGTTMDVEIVDELIYDAYEAVIPEVTGQAWYTGRSGFVIDPADPLREGFLLR